MTLSKLISVLVIVTVAHSQSYTRATAARYDPQPVLSANPPTLLPVDYLAQLTRSVLPTQQTKDISDGGNAPSPTIALSLQLPREEAPPAFYTANYNPLPPSDYSTIRDYSDEASREYDAPSSELRAPSPGSVPSDYASPSVSYFELPEPALELRPPVSVAQWNPDNDPTLYYQLPVEITKETVPTNVHPKKYNKVVFEKTKPTATRPKEEVDLIPVSEQEILRTEQKLQKTAYNLAKAQNQRQLAQQQQVTKPQSYKSQYQNHKSTTISPLISSSSHKKTVPTVTRRPGNNVNALLSSSSHKSNSNNHNNDNNNDNSNSNNDNSNNYKGNSYNNNQDSNNKDDTLGAETASGFAVGFDSDGVLLSNRHHLSNNNDDLQQLQQQEFLQPLAATGLNGAFTAVAGGSLHAAAPLHSGGERVDFQMHGHDGPHSYKWGYDTGKGHGRQFRYEERDKEGNVKGHFGFFDKRGKLQMVHYDANPHDGYHAEGSFGKL